YMAPKRRGALQLVQREVEEINRQRMIWKIADRPRYVILNFLYGVLLCYILTSFQADELAPVGNYDQRKQEEERRLQSILERLNSLSLELSPPGPSSAAGSVSSVLVAKQRKEMICVIYVSLF
uniref:Uncharacterized protein n=1 Tax=Acanthochromis polyacanthus TaxID=80966 RepID=A0A3Q1FZK0_9TELE